MRSVSVDIAVAVADVAYASGLATERRPSDLRGYIQGLQFDPRY
jgi:malate dehydrogenase (oxaloacetate-decarboxylating)(NADP+)